MKSIIIMTGNIGKNSKKFLNVVWKKTQEKYIFIESSMQEKVYVNDFFAIKNFRYIKNSEQIYFKLEKNYSNIIGRFMDFLKNLKTTKLSKFLDKTFKCNIHFIWILKSSVVKIVEKFRCRGMYKINCYIINHFLHKKMKLYNWKNVGCIDFLNLKKSFIPVYLY